MATILQWLLDDVLLFLEFASESIDAKTATSAMSKPVRLAQVD
jgi:hypothetical protein